MDLPTDLPAFLSPKTPPTDSNRHFRFSLLYSLSREKYGKTGCYRLLRLAKAARGGNETMKPQQRQESRDARDSSIRQARILDAVGDYLSTARSKRQSGRTRAAEPASLFTGTGAVEER
jgi:hypothetical protein